MSFIGQVISWGCTLAYMFGIPSPFDITDARNWIGAMMPTPVVIALCVSGIIVTGPLLWTSTWWWPRLLQWRRPTQMSLAVLAQPSGDLERFRASLPHVQRCRELVRPFTGVGGFLNLGIGVSVFVSGDRIIEVVYSLQLLSRRLHEIGVQSPSVAWASTATVEDTHSWLRSWSLYLAQLEVLIRQDDLAGARLIEPFEPAKPPTSDK